MFRLHRGILPILFLIINVQAIYCQTFIYPEKKYFRGRFFNYPVTEPGADVSTHRVFIDSKGFLWQGTYNGIHRFDGMEYKSFYSNISDNNGLAGNTVTDICEDSSGILWIATFGAINRLDQKSWTMRHFSPDTSDLLKACNRIFLIHEDRTGLFWLLTGEDVYTFNRNSETFRRYPIDTLSYIPGLMPINAKGKILEDSAGEIWITSNYGLYKYDRTGDSLRIFKNIPGDDSSLQNNSVTNITEDFKGRIWCTTLGGGLYKITDPEKEIFRKIDLGVSDMFTAKFDSLNLILPDSKGKIWLFGKGTVSCFDPETDETDNFILPPPIYYIPDPHAKEIDFTYAFEDKKGEIWFLFDVNGFLFRMDPVTHKTIFYPVPNSIVINCIMDNTGSLWLGCIRNNTWRLVVDDLPFQLAGINNTIFINYMHFDRIVEHHNKIWLSLKPKIYEADSISLNSTLELKPISLFGNGIRATCFFKESSGSLWIGRNDNKISCLRKDGSGMVDYSIPSPDDEIVSGFYKDQNNTLWIFTPNKVFILPEGENNVSLFTFHENDLAKTIRTGTGDVIIDKSDRIWFTSAFGNGIYTYDIQNKTIKYYSSESGLDIPYGDACMSIEEDSRGRIWALFYIYGLFMFDPATDRFKKIDISEDTYGRCNYLYIFIDKDQQIKISHTAGFTFYNPETERSRNIRFRQYLGDCCFFRPEKGNLIYFMGSQLLIFPDSIPENNNIPPVYITSILVNDIEYCNLYPSSEETTLVNKINLGYKQNNLRISFTALDYLDPKYNRYSYFMNGIDEDTINTTADYRIAEYKKIRPGKYSFWFTGSNNDGKWNTDGKTLHITVMAPWYGSAIAYFVYGLAFISLMVFIVRIRLSHLRKEKVLLEKLVSQRTAELEEKNKKILELDNLKTRFFTEISHEIRTPLSLISGPIENLIRENDEINDERRMKWLEMVRRNARRLMKLVDQLLDLSRLDAGKMRILLTEDDILNCLRILVNEFLSLGERRKIRFTIDIPPGSFVTYFDRDKIEKIISNLLSNAFKFTPSWGTVSCSVRIFKSERKNIPHMLEIFVKDSGVGITSENLEKIFDRFYRVEGQWEKDGSGAGIGLSLSNEFVRLLKGTLKVSSEPGSGSLFEVTIPLGKDHLKKDEYVIIKSAGDEESVFLHPDEPLIGDEEKDPLAHKKNVHVLVIEDNTDLRTFIADNLSQEYHVYEADNGKTGHSVALAKIPDLIVTDVIMPDMDGVELCSRIKNDERTCHIPVIMLTAKTTSDDKIAGLKSGADDYLFKPFEVQELLVRISNLITLREKLRLKFGSLTGLEHTAGQIETIDERFMRKVLSVIHDNLKDFDFDVGVLQEKIGMSRVHLYRKLKAITGLSPSTLIRNCRMKEAATIIGNGPVNLSILAMSVGFSNPSHFAKCFREYFRVSPKDYAKQQKKL